MNILLNVIMRIRVRMTHLNSVLISGHNSFCSYLNLKEVVHLSSTVQKYFIFRRVETEKLSPRLCQVLLLNYRLIYFLPIPLALVELYLSTKESPFERIIGTGVKNKHILHNQNKWIGFVCLHSSRALGLFPI